MKTLSKSDGFGPLLKTRPIGRTQRLMVHWLQTESGASAELAVGVMVPKRFAKRAVDRHTLKRLIREACRTELKNRVSGQVLVRLTKPVQAVPYSQRPLWWNEIRHLLQNLLPS